MQLSKKSKKFCGIFIVFLESTLNFKHCEKKNEPHSLSFSHIIDPKRRGYLKCIKGSVSSTVNVLASPKNC